MAPEYRLGVLIDPIAEPAFARRRPPEHAYPHLGPLGRRFGQRVTFFSPAGVRAGNGRVDAWHYGPRGWERGSFPLPRAVYNRLARRTLESRPAVRRLLERIGESRLLFNPFYLQKDAALRALSDARVATPRFAVVRSLEEALQCLRAWGALYLKPVGGSLGRGIVRIEPHGGRRAEPGFFVTANGHGFSPPSARRLSLPALAAYLRRLLPYGPYIAQERVLLPLIEGGVVDLRALVQRTEDGWRLTGVSGRLAPPGHPTTHTLRGGRPVPFSLVEEVTGARREDVEALAVRAAEAIERAYGRRFFEFSADVAALPGGVLQILEINAKPFPFDEDEIRELSAERLLEYAASGGWREGAAARWHGGRPSPIG